MSTTPAGFYDQAYFLGTSPKRGNFSLLDLGPKFIDRAQTVIDYFNLKTAQPSKIAEVGCGTAPFYRLITQRSDLDHLDVVCTDISDQGIQLLPTADQPPLIVATAENLPFEGASLSGIISWDVLEHLENPESALVEAYRVLSPGGFLHIVCPNPGSWLDTYKRDKSHVFPAIVTLNFLQKTLDDIGFSFTVFTRGFPGTNPQQQTGLLAMQPAKVDATGTHLVVFAQKI